ncbi:MAG: hypothetical protein D6696_00090 [Acidobacteria bacterium]|nr:MAG: hypothetical protein D6696_00090 [Acidobacteriota bacterium]
MRSTTERPPLALGLVLAALLPAAAAGDVLSGRLELAGKARDGDLAGAVVYYQPDRPPARRPPSGTFEVVTVRKSFEPRVLAVPVGSTVRFPNQDPILHNVFSVSGPNRFDLGLYRQGDGKSVTFSHPGVVRVFCNVHHAMVAYVLVLESPFFVQPAADGSFRLDGLPSGPGTLTVWHERAEPQQLRIALPHGEPLALELVLDRPRVPPHLNKLGKPYKNLRGRRYHR